MLDLNEDEETRFQWRHSIYLLSLLESCSPANAHPQLAIPVFTPFGLSAWIAKTYPKTYPQVASLAHRRRVWARRNHDRNALSRVKPGDAYAKKGEVSE